MVKPVDDELLSDLWQHIKTEREKLIPFDPVARAELAVDTLKLTAHWRDTGWNQRGKHARPTDAQGRGLHDMHMPSKWP